MSPIAEKLSQAAFQYVKQYDSEIITEQWFNYFKKSERIYTENYYASQSII